MEGKGKTHKTLSKDDLAIWQEVVGKISPLKPKPVGEQAQITNTLIKTRRPAPSPLHPFVIGERVQSRKTPPRLYVPMTERVLSPDMDKRSFARLRKGKFNVDARLDLHGMTLAQAHRELTEFIHKCYRNKKRLLLVITGKSGDRRTAEIMPERRGVLKHQVPQWLGLPTLSPMILEVTSATRKHGGEGALYVYLKRQR